ncbi:hypothetical protein VSS37_13430 [Candidatus Thiothrix sp. Deng01]|uniref:Uncharacterized protein n=1 Tax=Candidatus Thiothrix phosphatis TaxID=3112415 RepID=A0ABU6CYW4_9GAMM|nr:hypothetical protein [Candidatus Thiothrix sp. Deng01]MEB4591989.1 hypothetical protein [Candidatus Thiothrix sp. Deng01]
MNGYEQALNQRIDELRAERNGLLVELGFARETIRELLEVMQAGGFGCNTSAYRVARRWLDSQGAQP